MQGPSFSNPHLDLQTNNMKNQNIYNLKLNLITVSGIETWPLLLERRRESTSRMKAKAMASMKNCWASES